MRTRDIAIQISLVREHPRSRVGQTCHWPVRVSRRQVEAPFEGLPTRIGVYQCQIATGKPEIFVFVVFGRATPTARQLDRVNAELHRARLR